MGDENVSGGGYGDNVVGRGRFPNSPAGGGGEGGDFELSARIIRLEENFKSILERSGRVEDKLDRISERLGGLPGKVDLLTFAAAMIALMGLLLAGLGWLETRASRISAPDTRAAPPIVIQLPAGAALVSASPVKHR